jgi:hypothetical protein
MAEAPNISDADIVAAVSARRPDATDVRVRKRRVLRPTAGLTGSYFERVQLDIGGKKVNAILKKGTLDFGPPTREHLFFAALVDGVPIAVPAAYGVGPTVDAGDSWVLMEALPRGKRLVDWTIDNTTSALCNLAELHAHYLDRAPASLPRPFTDRLEETLSYLPASVARLREVYDAFPHLPRIVSERQLDLVLELGRRTDVFRERFARSPQTMLHGDYHRGNLLLVDGRPLTAFDWQFVCAGPPAYDLAVFWLYLGIVNKRGFFGFFDRTQVRDREMTWAQVTETYTRALLDLRRDVDVDALLACADQALAWEIIRQTTYMGYGLEHGTAEAFVRFIYRDHRTVGGWFARWAGIEDVWKMYVQIFGDFEARAERLLAAPTRL